MRLKDTARGAHVAAGAISGPGEYGGKGATVHGDLSGFPGEAQERGNG